MRDFKGMKRQRGRNRKPGGGGGNNANAANPNRSWDSQGPENIKVRGNAQTVYERYQQLARDAGSSGDRVLAENYLQHAEHYFRVLRALQPQRPVSEIAARELSNQGYDIDFEDETGAQAAAFLAAQQASDRQSQPGEGGDRSDSSERAERDGQSGNQGANGGGQPREWRDRPDRDRNDRDRNDRDRYDRERNDNRPPRADRADRDDRPARVEASAGDAAPQDGESREGGRRESRRERWERRRDERGNRFERDAGDDTVAVDPGAEALAGTPYEPAADDVAPVPSVPVAEREPRRTRTPRREAQADPAEDIGLPSFLTRAPAPAPVEAATETVAPAKKPRAPRRKSTVTAAENEV